MIVISSDALQRKMILMLPTHTQMSVVARFKGAHVDKLIQMWDEENTNEDNVKWFNARIASWAPELRCLCVNAMRLDIDKLILSAAPQAKVDPTHPMNKIFGDPPNNED